MAVTIQLYNHTTLRFANGANAATDTYKVALLNSSSSFVASHTAASNVMTGVEVYGNGWTQGGETLTNVTISTVTTNDAMFDADDISVTATGGPIGPAYNAVLINATDANSPPVAYINFGEAKQADVGTPFKINWNAAGIITFTYT